MQTVSAHAHSPSRAPTAIAWILQVAVAGLFFFAGAHKLAGDPMMVQLFDVIGAGQWFRYFTGTIEVAGAAALLIPRLAPLAAGVLALVMVGAVITHLFIVGGNPVLPIALFAALGAVLYLRRHHLEVLHE